VRILVVDDHAGTRKLLDRHLEQAGHVVQAVDSCSEVLAALGASKFDVVVLDVMLPDGSGIELCRQMRKDGRTVPVLLLSARGEVRDRVTGLEAGADDYLIKPFALSELLARVTALARRGPTLRARSSVFGPVVVDFEARRVMNEGKAVPLTAMELSIVEVLATRRGRVVTRDDLIECVWGERTESTESSLEVLVGRIRRKLGASSSVLRTARGLGYLFEWDE
jgi:two-component system, OmpR family, response regulator